MKPYIKIVISAIIPRPVDHDKTDEFVRKVNGYLSKTMNKNMNFTFIRTYKPFVHSGNPRTELFDNNDKLHLNAEGSSKLRNYFLRTMASL